MMGSGLTDRTPHQGDRSYDIMKKLILFLCCTVVFYMAAMRAQVGSELCTPNFPWAIAATWTTAGDEPTALAVGERTYKTINTAIAAAVSGDDEIEIYTMPYGTNAIRIRVVGFADNYDIVFDVLSGTFDGSRDDCAMVLRGTLTFTVGTQLSAIASYEFADTAVLTANSDAASTSVWTITSPGTGSETCAEALLDMQGDDRLVLVPTALAANAYVLIKPY